MGKILDLYGDAAHDHEGYPAQVLDDGTLTSEYNTDTIPRMVGQVIAACDCGWIGATRYPSTDPFDEAAQEMALREWERDHARPTLEALRATAWEHLRTLVRQLAESHATTTRARFHDLPASDQRAVLDNTLDRLHRATELARRLRAPLDPPGGAR